MAHGGSESPNPMRATQCLPLTDSAMLDHLYLRQIHLVFAQVTSEIQQK